MTYFNYILGIPDSVHNPSTDQPNMQINNDNINNLLAVDHVNFNFNNGGTHKQITFPNDPTSVVIPGTQTDPGATIYRDVGSASAVVELFYKNANAVLPLSCIKAFGVFTTNASSSVTTFGNKFNVDTISSVGGIYTINLTPNVVTTDNIIVLLTTQNSNINTVWTFSNPVLNITYNASGPKISFAILQY